MAAETVVSPSNRIAYQLRFQAPSATEKVLVFPCDAQGRVDLNALDRRSLADYLYARALVGRRFLAPAVMRVA